MTDLHDLDAIVGLVDQGKQKTDKAAADMRERAAKLAEKYVFLRAVATEPVWRRELEKLPEALRALPLDSTND